MNKEQTFGLAGLARKLHRVSENTKTKKREQNIRGWKLSMMESSRQIKNETSWGLH